MLAPDCLRCRVSQGSPCRCATQHMRVGLAAPRARALLISTRARGGGGSDGHGEPGRGDNGSSWWLRAAAVGASLVIAGCSAAYLISRTRDRRRKPNDQKGAKEDLARVPRVRQRKLLPALFDEGCGLAIRKLMDTADVTSVAERLCLKDDHLLQDADALDPSSGSCIWVGTIEELWSLREDLRGEPEVSLDLEHHSSFV